MQSENIDNSDEIAMTIALVVSMLTLSGWLLFVFLGIYKGDSSKVTVTLIATGAGIVCCVLLFFIVRYFFAFLLAPGEYTVKVMDKDKAPNYVRASHATVLGLVSYAFYKIFGRKDDQGDGERESDENQVSFTVVELDQ